MTWRKLLGCLGCSALLWLAAPAVSSAQHGRALCATFGTPCVSTHHCPPPFKYTYEGAPHIHFQRGCPHPICNPCDLPHWGYFDTCWTPWPYPPNWSHCPVPPPASYVHVNPYGPQSLPTLRTIPGTSPMLPAPNVAPEEIQQLPPPRPGGRP
jgi:hypothetical protein